MRTHCKHGHQMTEENTYHEPGSNRKHCRQCRREWQAEYRNLYKAPRKVSTAESRAKRAAYMREYRRKQKQTRTSNTG